ncbi:isoleucine--tRNA ligase [bacterium]|jgi:isoleucyl-tRNA synthetase|nr:isoleucine--tRNA ligase [bacterium]MBT4648752.1 isoleucine--tRNA ligase [bacterium]
MTNFKDREKEILDFWESDQTFQKSLDKPAPNGDYLFYDGPPFATGTPHYGHLVGNIMKDVVPRFWTMQGYRVERKWGWDCHGLPVENIVEKELGSKSKQAIEEMGVAKFNELCRSKVLSYVAEWEKTVTRMGRWADMKNAYRTMDLEYMESVWWVFKELWDKDLIYQDYRSMHICPRCETTLSQQEVSEGYKDIKDLSLTAKFELVDEPGTYVLAWTTTPWTLIGNVALAVGENIDYIKVESEKEKFILAKELLEEFADKFGEYKIVEEFKGKKLIAQKYTPLFDYYSKDKDSENVNNGWQIVTADFVTTEEGTGVVHIAPAFGEDDMRLGKEKNLPFVQHLGMDGIIKEEVTDFKGLHVKPIDDVQSTDVAIIKYLAAKGLLFDKTKYEHSYPHCWRCETPLLNYATSSWFVAVTKVKDKAQKTAKNINWTPDHIKEGRFGKWLEGARDWSISRQRFWASVMPIWECDKCEEKVVFGSVADLEKASGQKVTDLHKHIVDEITFACSMPACRQAGGSTMKRVPDVLDTWFDSGSMPYAQMHYPFENEDRFNDNFPAKFIAEGLDQTRAWFYYMHILAVAIKGSQAFDNVIVNGIVLAEDGKKMAKKLQNYPDPNDIMEKYGADALRLYLLSSPVMLAENLSFVEKDLQTTYRRFIGLLQNVFSFYQMFKGEAKIDGDKLAKLNNDLDKWIVAKFYKLHQEVTEAMKEYNLVKATRPLFDFVDELSTWYLRRSRDRFKGDDLKDKEQAIETLAFILKQFAKLIAPFTPMTADIIWQEFDNKTSVHLEEWMKADQKLIDQEVLAKMDMVRQIAESVHAARAEAGIKVRQPLSTLKVADKSGLAKNKDYLNILSDELNVESVIIDDVITADGWIVTEVNDFKVSLDTNLTDDLKEKGILRELIRFINVLRKESGLKPADKPVETYQTESKNLLVVIEKYKEEIIKSTSAGSLEKVDTSPERQKVQKINGEEIILGLITPKADKK